MRKKLYWFLHVVLVWGTAALAEIYSNWFLLLIFPIAYILGYLQQKLLFDEAPPMPKIKWSENE